MLNYYTPLVAVIIALIIFIWIACIVMSLQREGLNFSDLDKWEDTPVILPTDSLVGPRVTDQEEVLQVEVVVIGFMLMELTIMRI